MEHQGQRNGEGGHHDQRIGRHEKVRRLERKKMRPSRRSHCPHGDCHDEVGDSEKAPGVCCPASANCVLCQQRSHDDGNAARRNVPDPRRQGKLPGQARQPKAREKCRPRRGRPEPPRANAAGSRRPALRCFPIATGQWRRQRAGSANRTIPSAPRCLRLRNTYLPRRDTERQPPSR